MTAEETVKIAKIKAKWKEELNRRDEARMAIDFYFNRQHETLEKDINNRYPKEDEDIQRYKFTVPLTRNLINQLAITFKESPTIKMNEVSEAVQEAFLQFLDDIDLYKLLKQIDIFTELTGKIGIVPRWDGERVCLDILTPDKCYVIENPEVPTEAIEVGYPIGITNDWRMAEPMNIYAIWTADSYRESEVNRDGLEVKVLKRDRNPYGKIPIAWYEIVMPLDSFWTDEGNPIVELNRRINLQMTNLDIAMDYQSFSTLVTTGMSDTTVIPIGVTRRINIPTNPISGESMGSASYITPDAKLLEVWKIIQESIIWYAGIMGISVESISSASSFSSGYQLKLAKSGVLERNKNKQDIYLESIRDTIKLALQCEKIYGKQNFPDEPDLTIRYGEISIDYSPMELQQLISAKLANGTIDIIGAIMLDNPDMTEDEAIKYYQKMKNRKAQIAPEVPPLGLESESE